MKQRVLSLVVAFFAATALWAYDFKSSNLSYNILSENTVEVTYELTYAGSSYVNDFNLTHVIIPAMVINDGITYDVTRIGEYAFSCCRSLTSITIPNSVTSIGHRAFEGTSWFESLPDGPVYINNILYTYKGKIPENTSIVVKEGTTSICDFAFDYQHYLSSIIIPNGVTDIGDYAFSQCHNLTDITIPQSVINIGHDAFADTPWFDSLPNGLVYINDVLYTYKDSMPDNTSLVISDSTKSQGNRIKS